LDLSTLLKSAAVLVTSGLGAFGVVGEFRDKNTGKLTKLGWAAIVAIFVSCAVALLILFLDSREAEKAKQKAAMDILRLLNPIDNPTLDITFKVNCKESLLKGFCQAALAPQRSQWQLWPNSKILQKIIVDVTVFLDPAAADTFQTGKFVPKPLVMTVTGESHEMSVVGPGPPPSTPPPGGPFSYYGETRYDGNVYLSISGKPWMQNDGTVASLLDFSHAVIFINYIAGDVGIGFIDHDSLIPTALALHGRNHVTVGTSGNFRPIEIPDGKTMKDTYYKFDFTETRP